MIILGKNLSVSVSKRMENESYNWYLRIISFTPRCNGIIIRIVPIHIVIKYEKSNKKNIIIIYIKYEKVIKNSFIITVIRIIFIKYKKSNFIITVIRINHL